ncbi:MAG TPA: T9SS type A sorting domain-containing protein, partial [Bacteroidia bacterium]|nr:T9SS type A sorting domain-containing protein [Bacteroidia bacterium]
PGYYYFFYDWEVQPSGCTSSRVAVTATLNPEVIKPEITENNDLLSGPSLPGLTYQWYMNGNQIAGATNQTYAPTSNGNYTLQVSNGKCSSTSDIYSFTIGIHSYELDKLITVYPNPVNETIFIDIPLTVSARNIRVEIYAATGKLIYQETYSNNGQVHKLDVSPLKTSGIYLLRLQSGDKEFVKKITLNR